MCSNKNQKNSSALIFWIAMSVLFDFFSINVYRSRQNNVFFLQKFLVLYFLIMLIHVQSIGIYIYLYYHQQDNRTSEWKVQSKLLISWEHLGVLKIDWNDQKLKQFLWIVYCNTHSFLDKSNLNHYENKKKIISISVVASIGCGEYRSLWSHFFDFFL